MKTSLLTSLALLAAGCSHLPTPVPAALEPAAGSPALTVAARGVQVYQCRAGKGGAEWVFVAPEARLYDHKGLLVGEHGAGPFWLAADGSRIDGTVKARADAPTADAIPWLLLSTKSSGPHGVLSRVTSVQRINTAGGLAPAVGCSAETMGATARVSYTADYVFFAAK